jgi:P27 family predicted phage terminase small subunit
MPQRKARARRQGRATSDLGIVEVSPVGDVPAVPRGFLVETRRAWSAFWQSELASLVTEADHPALVRLFRLYDARARFAKIVVAEPMVAGSKGQTRVSPAAGELASLDARIVTLEDRFGLSPLARFRLGVMFGAAARSIESLNAEFAGDDRDDEDPRSRVVDIGGVDAAS